MRSSDRPTKLVSVPSADLSQARLSQNVADGWRSGAERRSPSKGALLRAQAGVRRLDASDGEHVRREHQSTAGYGGNVGVNGGGNGQVLGGAGNGDNMAMSLDGAVRAAKRSKSASTVTSPTSHPPSPVSPATVSPKCGNTVTSETTPARDHRSINRASSTGAASSSSSRNFRAFRALAHGIRGIARAQTLTDEGVGRNVDVTSLVQRIAVTLGSIEVYKKVARSVFLKFAIQINGARGTAESGAEPILPLQSIPKVLEHWQIPEDHVPMFWAFLRKQPAFFDEGVLPDYLDYDNFQEVLIRVLRRVRDRYCDTKVVKDRWVTQNKRRLEQEYILEASCGKGSFGECFFVTQRLSKLKRVCKKILKEEASMPSEEVQSELEALRSLDHPGILRVFEWFESDDAYFMVLEAAFGGDLKNLLAKVRDDEGKPGLDEDLTQDLTAQSLKGLAYIHSQRIIHRDIKPANMLLASPLTADGNKPRVLLGDFGVAELFEDHGRVSSLVKGTIVYMAPEVFSSQVCPRSDVWALGIVVYELFCGTRPFIAENPMAMYARLKTAKLQFQPVLDVGASQAAAAFIGRLLTKACADRPSAMQALEDPWLGQHCASPLPQGRLARKVKKSLSNYNSMGYFCKATMNYIAAQLDTNKIESLAEIFGTLDSNGDGSLTMAEMAAGLAELGVDVDSIGQIIDSVDMNGDGLVQYTEFIAALLQTQGKLIEDLIGHAFKLFDANDDNKISVDELRAMLSGDGPLVAVLPDGKTVEQVLREIDTSGDNCISYSEFRAYIRRQSRRAEGVSINSGSQMLQLEDRDESLEKTLRRLAARLGRSEADLAAQAKRLAEVHWINTIGDLKDLEDCEWQRLGLPLKLERALHTHISGCSPQNRRS